MVSIDGFSATEFRVLAGLDVTQAQFDAIHVIKALRDGTIPIAGTWWDVISSLPVALSQYLWSIAGCPLFFMASAQPALPTFCTFVAQLF